MRHAGYTKRRLDDLNVRACLTGGAFLLEGLMKEVESADILRQLPTDESRVNVRCVEPWASLSLNTDLHWHVLNHRYHRIHL